MKYQLGLSLEAFARTAPQLDITDAMILDYLRDICISQNEKIAIERVLDDGYLWTWVNYSHLMTEMPYIKIKAKSTISKAISRLRVLAFIESRRLNHQRLYVRLLPKLDLLIFSSELSKKGNSAISLEKQPQKESSFPRETAKHALIYQGNKNYGNKKLLMSDPDDSNDKNPIEDDQVQKIFQVFISKILPGSRLTKKAKAKIKTRLEEFSMEDILKGIDNFSKDSWWMEHNAFRGITWFFYSEDRTEQFKNLMPRDKTEKKEVLRKPKFK